MEQTIEQFRQKRRARFDDGEEEIFGHDATAYKRAMWGVTRVCVLRRLESWAKSATVACSRTASSGPKNWDHFFGVFDG